MRYNTIAETYTTEGRRKVEKVNGMSGDLYDLI